VPLCVLFISCLLSSLSDAAATWRTKICVDSGASARLYAGGLEGNIVRLAKYHGNSTYGAARLTSSPSRVYVSSLTMSNAVSDAAAAGDGDDADNGRQVVAWRMDNNFRSVGFSICSRVLLLQLRAVSRCHTFCELSFQVMRH